MGKNLKGKDLGLIDFRGAYLIAADLQKADFVGVNLRAADLSGANLSGSLLLTQMQINSAKGNSETRLPVHLQRSSHGVY